MLLWKDVFLPSFEENAFLLEETPFLMFLIPTKRETFEFGSEQSWLQKLVWQIYNQIYAVSQVATDFAICTEGL